MTDSKQRQKWIKAFLALFALAGNLAHADSAPPPTIAIIIDDVGNSRDEALRLIHLPYPLTLSILPFRPHSTEIANLSHEVGKEVMLHIPMENTRGMALGSSALTRGMKEADFTLTLRQALLSIPYLSGMNNHMGSALTQDSQAMQWTMTELRRYPLYFVDSRTTAQTLAQQTAQTMGIPNLARDVFLDHVITPEAIDHEFKRLLKLARERGTAVAIGHPHKATVEYLEKNLPQLGEKGFAIATVSALWMIRHQGLAMFDGRRPSRDVPSLAGGGPTREAEKLN